MTISTHDNFVVVKEKSNDLKKFIFLLKPLLTTQLKDKNLIIDLLDYQLMCKYHFATTIGILLLIQLVCVLF